MVSEYKFISSWSKMFVIAGLIFLLSCSVKEQGQPKNDFLIKQIEAIEDVSEKLVYEIISNFYEYNKKPVVHVDFKTTSSDKSVDGAFESFIYNGILKTFIKAEQVSVKNKPDVPIDCSLILDITKDTEEKIYFKATLYRRDQTRLLEKSYSYKKRSFNMSGFEQYKSKHNKIKPTAVPKKPKKQADRTGKNGKAHLIVKGEPTGKFADTRGPRCIEMTIYRLTDHEFAGGRSCFFPTRLSCRINGETYEAAGDKTIFKGTINPGRIKFTAWFLESYWDTFTCKQNIGKRHQKTFYVDIKKNDNIKVFINYIYTDEKASIFAGVYTEVTVIKNGKKIKKFKETMVR